MNSFFVPFRRRRLTSDRVVGPHYDPSLHLFGHIHEDRDQWLEEGIQFVNASNPEGALPAMGWTMEKPEVKSSGPTTSSCPTADS